MAAKRTAPWFSIALNLLGWAGGLFLIALLIGQARAVQDSRLTVSWGPLIASVGLGMLGHGVQALVGRISLGYLRHPIDLGTMYRVWFLSQVAKYIPGGVWQVASRAGVYTQRGLPPAVATAATLWEILAILLGSLILCLGAAGLAPASDLPIALAGATAALLLAGAILSQIRGVWVLLARVRVPGASRMLRLIDDLGAGRLSMLAQMTGLALLTWVIIGAAFALFLSAFVVTQPPGLVESVVIWNAAWAAGFLVVFTPSGLGAREAVLSALLPAYIAAPQVAAVVIAARLWWHVCEGLHIAAAALWALALRLPAPSRVRSS